MDQKNSDKLNQYNPPAAIVRRGRSLSIIWVVPLIALMIGGWLSLKAWSDKGTVIKIAFETAEGLEAGKTVIRFKEVEVGKVIDIELNDDLAGVIVTAEMNKSVSKYMRDQTQYWVVRARVAAGEISGLGTIFSGAYIGCNLSEKGKETVQFVGLDKPPVITFGMPGRHYVLEAKQLGSLDVGSPVYYRGIKVGQVVDYGFDGAAEAVHIRVFVKAPYNEKVRQNTRFWNVSGVDFKLDAEGVSVDTQSLISILLGGVAFDLPKHMQPVDVADEGRLFSLYPSQKQIEERFYSKKNYFMLYFDQNVRGLQVGAPVEVKGIKIGEVVDVNLEINVENVAANVAVLVVLEPERIDAFVDKDETVKGRVLDASEDESVAFLSRLVEKGLRAQLKTGNLLTGQLYVDLDFYADAEPAKIESSHGTLVIPTLPAPFEQIAQRVNNILKKVEKMPLEEISYDLRAAINSLNETLKTAEDVAGGVRREIMPELKKTLDDFQKTLQGVEQTLGPNSALNYNAYSVMQEMTTTIRSLRALIDYVERNPESILFGKEAE